MLPDSSFPYMIKLDEAGGLAVVSSLFVCRYERRYAAGEGSFPRKAEVLRRSAVMCFNQLYQQKPYIRKMIKTEFVTNYIIEKPYIRKMIETGFVTKKQCPCRIALLFAALCV